ncbi:MAG: Ig-like domain-containing protein [Bacteroidota bacterium]
MKKLYSTIISFFVFGTVTLFGQSLAGYKICINPGHGGHDSNDREIILDDGIVFWESDGNLAKGLYLKTMLENLGATVVMTRVTNTTNDDLPLSQIVAIANTNNVDYFHSIHSNATGTSSKQNYTLILFQGRTNAPTYAGSLTMANYLGPNINKVDRTTRWTVAGDFDFYGTGQPYLGVFKGLNMPGTLSEGSFHDYFPEAYRLKSEGYLKHEAWGIARSFLQYFNGGTYTTGIIAGIVRDTLETVPASYNPISGTRDNYKPINNIKVTLNPGGRVYNGDTNNNGYYLFDDLAPGTYSVIVEADKMRPDTATVVAQANQSVFSDRMMTLNPILDPPNITSYSPSDSVNAVSNVSPIVINFDIRMKDIETQNAFSISPNVAGSFSWNTDLTSLTFKPTKSYVPGTKYTVTISKSAKTFFGINLPQDKIFSFTTRSQLNVTSTYPTNNLTDVSTTVLIKIKFEKGIDGTTLGGRISLNDANGNSIPVTVKSLGSVDGLISFEPKTPLDNDATYRINLKVGIGDVEYVTLASSIVIEFQTEKRYTFTGNVIEDFETNNVWQSPLNSPNTKGITVSQTSFSLSGERKINGSNSGNLNYQFSDSTGLIDLSLLNPILLTATPQANIGVWIFGDNSKNIVEYKFLRQGTNEAKVKVDTLNWTGWKLKKVLLTDIPGSGAIQFQGINIVQARVGLTSGRLFFDDCTNDIITDVKLSEGLPATYQLEQNYPNPFNPTTVIGYQLSKAGNVSLKVYDVLGREVATLVEAFQHAGHYKIMLSADNYHLSSGIYFYRLEAGNFVSTKKLILLK